MHHLVAQSRFMNIYEISLDILDGRVTVEVDIPAYVVQEPVCRRVDVEANDPELVLDLEEGQNQEQIPDVWVV